jgi:hypothetical protein
VLYRGLGLIHSGCLLGFLVVWLLRVSSPASTFLPAVVVLAATPPSPTTVGFWDVSLHLYKYFSSGVDLCAYRPMEIRTLPFIS